MKTSTVIKLLYLSILLLAAGNAPAFGQGARLQIASLDNLEARASKTLDVTVDGSLIRLANVFLNSKKPDEARVKELIQNLKGVYVKRYEFEQPGQFTTADIAPIRSQLTGNAGWTRIVGVRTKNKEQNVDVFTMLQGNIIGGLAVLVTEEKAVTVVNIVGPIDLEKLAALEGQFGIPALDLEVGDKKKEQ